MVNKICNNELTDHLSQGIQDIIRQVLVNTIKNPRETAFLLEYVKVSQKAQKIRADFENKGQHIPSFLIASITNSCNLHCKGCYARGTGLCDDKQEREMLSATKWDDIFSQAASLGIGFILLSGGEPLMRRDVICIAAEHKEIIFPIFTNGLMLETHYVEMLNKHRNLIPILSIEGDQSKTDDRRGEGVYALLVKNMSALHDKNILFGASLTVTKENMEYVTDKAFIGDLMERGCKVMFFVEYVPILESTRDLAFSDAERSVFAKRVKELMKLYSKLLILSFPGDEEELGGCLAAGRGFFHINPYGAAEACPFSPYSDCDLLSNSLLQVLQSPFFQRLQAQELVGGEHKGGCALFEQQEKVQAALAKEDD